MNHRSIAAAVAAVVLALIVVYAAGRLWTRGAADQFRAEMSSVAAERESEKAADAAKMWEDSAKLKEGMTEEEVRAIMGWQHNSGEYDGNKLFWQWVSRDATVDVIVDFTDGKVAKIERTRD